MKKKHKRLLRQGVIDLRGRVDGEMATHVRECMSELAAMGNPDIQVWITSDGGEIKLSLHIYDMLRTYPGTTHGRVVGYARSSAVNILQGCTRRTAERHADIRVHNNLKIVKLDALMSKKRIDTIIAQMQRDQSLVYKVLKSRSGQTKAAIRKLCKQDKDITAKEALDFGLIDEIE